MNLILGFLVRRATQFSVELSSPQLARAMSGEEAQAAGCSGGTNGNSTLPWNQTPSFQPGVTDMRVYSRKLSFLRDIWPAESVEHLAPPRMVSSSWFRPWEAMGTAGRRGEIPVV